MLSVELGANAEGATTTLVCDGDRRLLQPPTKVEIDLEKTCVVVAKKPPSPDFSADVRFSGSRAEATVPSSSREARVEHTRPRRDSAAGVVAREHSPAPHPPPPPLRRRPHGADRRGPRRARSASTRSSRRCWSMAKPVGQTRPA
jgi:hypothetical protein